MKSICTLALLFLLPFLGFGQQEEMTEAEFKHFIDSLENSFRYQTGTIALPNGMGTLKMPAGFKYLDPAQSEKILVDIWGNPKDTDPGLGMIMPQSQKIMSDTGYVFNVSYEAIGYVKDDDAADIDYKELMAEMKKDVAEANVERTKEGFPTVNVIGWAADPMYDPNRKVLYWAKELQFGAEEVNTLNYNVRILGRRGVLFLNAISTIDNLPLVQRDLPQVMGMVNFNKGEQYSDFDDTVDDVAAWTIGGLVAGKLLAKAGFFVLFLKFWKLIALGAAGLFGGIWKRFKGKKKDDDFKSLPPLPPPPAV